MQLSLRLGRARGYIRKREWRCLLHLIKRAIYSDSLGVGIRVDLTADQDPRPGSSDHPIRPATAEDLRVLADPARGVVESADELWQRRLRRHVGSVLGPDRCYVADVEGMGPSFMQYLFFAEDNASVQALFAGMYPVLAADEAMVEFLYVTPEARRYGLAVKGMVQVIGEARRRGAKSVVSFIRPDDKGAIFVCQSAGFKVDSLRRSRNRLFRQSITFEPRPDDMSEVLSRLFSADVRS